MDSEDPLGTPEGGDRRECREMMVREAPRGKPVTQDWQGCLAGRGLPGNQAYHRFLVRIVWFEERNHVRSPKYMTCCIIVAVLVYSLKDWIAFCRCSRVIWITSTCTSEKKQIECTSLAVHENLLFCPMQFIWPVNTDKMRFSTYIYISLPESLSRYCLL